jgi:hypothetical protein
MLLKVNKPVAALLSSFLVIYLLTAPTINAYENYLRNPVILENIKPVISYISKNHQENDLLYVYYGAQPAFRYYAHRFGFETGDYILGIPARENPELYLEEIANLKNNPRVWFVFSHNCSRCVVNERKYILEYLDNNGLLIDEFVSTGAGAYLYDLTRHP